MAKRDQDCAPAFELLGLAAEAQQALSSSPIGALRELRVDAAGDWLLLSGRVASFYQKQLAQEAVRAVAHGVALVNGIQVEYLELD